MKISKLFFVLAVSLVITFSSCKKSDADLLVGKWQGNEFYTNGQLDPFNNLFKAFTMEFKADGTGTYVGVATQPMKWTFNEDTKMLHIETEEVAIDSTWTASGDTINVKATLIDKEELWFEYVDDGDSVEQRWVRFDEK